MSIAKKNRSGFTLVELLAVSAAVSLLGTQIFPFLSQSREAARRTQCKNNLKQIGLALHNYHDTYRCLPIGWDGVDLQEKRPDVRGMNGWGWGSRILPFMDSAPLYSRLDFNRRIDAGQNVKLIVDSIPSFRCPSDSYTKKTWSIADNEGKTVVELATANYVGSFGTSELGKCEKLQSGEACQGDGVFFHNSHIGFRDITDGTSNTLAVGERMGDDKNDKLSTWSGVVITGTHPFARILGSSHKSLDAQDRNPSDYRSSHDNGVHVLMLDGSVRFLPNAIDLKTFQVLTTRNGGEMVPADFQPALPKGTVVPKAPEDPDAVKPKAAVPARKPGEK